MEPITEMPGWTREQTAWWIATRPVNVRCLAEEFPLGSVVGGDRYVIGWTEDDMLVVSPVWLGDDYERALAERQRVCATHVRRGDVSIMRALS